MRLSPEFMELRKNLEALNEKRRDIIELETNIKMLGESKRDIPLYQKMPIFYYLKPNKSSDLVVIGQIKSYQEDRMNTAVVRMEICEDTFGNSSNLAEAKRELEKEASIVPSSEMNAQTENTPANSPSMAR